MNNEPLPESTKLAKLLLNDKQAKVIEEALKEIEVKPHDYDIEKFWEMDRFIGGIGGYCMSLDPIVNPFPGGIARSLFRPLQYAASDIERNKDIYNNARYATQDSGQHLEEVTKLVIKKTTSVSNPARYKKLTLGQSTKFLVDKKALPPDSNITKSLKFFVKSYNSSKHGVNQNEERERLFSPADALISYISARIIGKQLLTPYYPEILKAVGEKGLARLKGLNLNL